MAGFGFPAALNTSGLQGTPIFIEASVDSDPGNPVTIFTVNVGSGLTLNLVQFLATAQFSGIFRIFHNSDLIGSARVRPGKPDAFFSWVPSRPIPENDSVRVDFESRVDSPVVEVDAFLFATES